MIPLEKMKLQLGITDDKQDPLIKQLLEDALEYILSFCNRTALPLGLVSTQIKIAVIAYNQIGVEGEQSRSEGGVSRTMMMDELPKSITNLLINHRLFKKVRNAT